MKTITKAVLLTGIIGLASLMTSCQTIAEDTTNTVMCDKCQVVWVKTPDRGGGPGKTGSYYAATDTKTMVCPDCESAIANFFKNGEFKHTCSSCGGTMVHCTNH